MITRPMAYQVIDVRARCPKCGRFVPWDAIGSEDYADPGAYYGVGSNEWTNCPKCGRVEGMDTTVTKCVPIEARP